MSSCNKTVVGFTGHQSLSALTADRVRVELTRLLAEKLPIVGVTSLAAGSDQIFAECVLELGGDLIVVIPSIGYEKTFSEPAALINYRRLLERAIQTRVLDHDAPDEAAYWHAGQKVVDQSDAIFAVWDGQPAAGLGGTADVVRYAKESGRAVTIVWPEGARRPT